MLSHYTLAVTATGAATTPATAYTRDLLDRHGAAYVLAQTNADVFFTLDGATTPVSTSGSEVGEKLDADNQGIILTAQEFVDSKWRRGSADARVQFIFRAGNIWTVG